MRIHEIVLKITNVCNLSCNYCYVFNKGDTAYMHEPAIMSENIIISLLQNINEYCKVNNLKSFLIIFHGGEPLIVGEEFYKRFMYLANDLVNTTQLVYTLQTNGTLLTRQWCDFLEKYNINFGVSLDGNRNACVNRIFKHNRHEAFDKVLKGYYAMKKYTNRAAILSVINTDITPAETYNFYKTIEVDFVDCLFPDSNYEMPDNNIKATGKWLSELFDLWYSDTEPKPDIRLFNNAINLFLGQQSAGTEALGKLYNTTITVRTNGDISPVDSIRICGEQYLKSRYNIVTHKLFEISGSDNIFLTYYNAHQDNIVCEKCKRCIINDICGGGMLAHRFSKENIFDNPSIYCYEIFTFLCHVQNVLVDDMPKELIEKLNITKLSLYDYN